MPDSKAGRSANGQYLSGVSGNPGGNPRQAGFAARCREATENGQELLKFALDVMRGKVLDRVVTKEGEVVDVEAPLKVRLDACFELMNRGFGRTPAIVDLEENPLQGQSNEAVLMQLLDSLPASEKKAALNHLARSLTPVGVPQ